MAGIALHDIFHTPCMAQPAASPLCRIDRLAAEIGRTAPEARAAAEEIQVLVADARAAGPSREEILEAIERVCDDELSGACASRIAEAVARVLRGR